MPLLVLVLGVLVLTGLVLGAVAFSQRSWSRRQLADARAEARRWVERLGGELLLLDGAAGATGATEPVAGLAEAAERFTAAGSELAGATTPRQCRLATQTAVEGLYHVRTARGALGMNPGPALPGGGVLGSGVLGGGILGSLREAVRGTVPAPPVRGQPGHGGRGWLAAVVEAVLTDLRTGAMPPRGVEPSEWARYWRERWKAAGDRSRHRGT